MVYCKQNLALYYSSVAEGQRKVGFKLFLSSFSCSVLSWKIVAAVSSIINKKIERKIIVCTLY